MTADLPAGDPTPGRRGRLGEECVVDRGILAHMTDINVAAIMLVDRWERVAEHCRVSVRFDHAPLADLIDALAKAVRTEPF